MIRGDGDTEVLRDHNRVYVGGLREHCPGSGMRVNDLDQSPRERSL